GHQGSLDTGRGLSEPTTSTYTLATSWSPRVVDWVHRAGRTAVANPASRFFSVLVSSRPRAAHAATLCEYGPAVCWVVPFGLVQTLAATVTTTVLATSRSS